MTSFYYPLTDLPKRAGDTSGIPTRGTVHGCGFLPWAYRGSQVVRFNLPRHPHFTTSPLCATSPPHTVTLPQQTALQLPSKGPSFYRICFQNSLLYLRRGYLEISTRHNLLPHPAANHVPHRRTQPSGHEPQASPPHPQEKRGKSTP